MSEKKDGVVYTMIDRAPWWVPWAFVFSLFFGWAVYQAIYAAQVVESQEQAQQVIRESSVASCERVNRVRQDINHRGEVLRQVIDAAIDSTDDPSFARELLDIRSQIEPTPLTDCERVFPPGGGEPNDQDEE